MCNDNSEYYKAYEKRYKQVYEKDMLWSSKDRTLEVHEVIIDRKISKKDKILEIGCGEGRDAIYLLDNGYNVFAVDYSESAINKCKSLSKNKYNENFKQFDLIKDTLNERFKFIYSIAVLHMFVLDEHRDKFLAFIREHLEEDGLAFICILGDGEKEYSSDIKDAFNDVDRKVLNNNEMIKVATTSCRIVSWETLEKEVSRNNLKVVKKWISDKVPEFQPAMCLIVAL